MPKVNIESNFSKSITERVFDESVFMLKTDSKLKIVAREFNVSTTTAWRDMRKRLPLINPEQYIEIAKLIESHKHGR